MMKNIVKRLGIVGLLTVGLLAVIGGSIGTSRAESAEVTDIVVDTEEGPNGVVTKTVHIPVPMEMLFVPLQLKWDLGKTPVIVFKPEEGASGFMSYAGAAWAYGTIVDETGAEVETIWNQDEMKLELCPKAHLIRDNIPWEWHFQPQNFIEVWIWFKFTEDTQVYLPLALNQ